MVSYLFWGIGSVRGDSEMAVVCEDGAMLDP